MGGDQNADTGLLRCPDNSFRPAYYVYKAKTAGLPDSGEG